MPHSLEIVNCSREGVGAGDGGEVGVAHLDPDRAAACLLTLERLAELLREPPQLRLELCHAPQVVIERGLSRLRLRDADRLQFSLVLETRQAPEVRAEAGAEPLCESVVRHRCERTEGLDPLSLQPFRGLWADARYESGPFLRETLPCLLRGELDEAVRLVGIGRNLGDELVGADADGAAEAGALGDGSVGAAGGGAGALELAEVEVGLVEADDLDPLDVVMEHGHDLARARAVVVEVGRDEDGLGAEPARPLGRGGGEDAELARLVAGGGDDGARAAARNDDRPARSTVALWCSIRTPGCDGRERCIGLAAVTRPTIGLFAINSHACASPEAAARIAALAESLGYDSLWAGEHVVVPSPRVPPSPMEPDEPIMDPLVALAHVAAHTEHVRLGTGVIIL